jgi:serine/threonine protein kinase
VTASGSSLPPPTAIPVQIGRYQVKRLLGQGGFGTVYEGWDPQLGRPVAIKVPKAESLPTQRVDAFLEEARRAVQLDHPGIVAVYDVGVQADQPYIVSRFIDGRTLEARLKEAPPSREQAVAWLVALADIVQFAHQRGWVHRDIKPSNVLVDHEGRLHVADFGLAAPLEELRQSHQGVAGTLAYMAPEIFRQEPGAARPDHRADLYALGVILYKMLTGRLPFRAESHDRVRDLILHSDPVPPRLLDPTIPAHLEEACLKALAKHPAQRYWTAADFKAALQPAPARSRYWPWLAGAALLLVVVLVIVFTRNNTPAPAGPGGPDRATAELLAEVRKLLRERDEQRLAQREAGDTPSDPPKEKHGEPWPRPLARLEADIKAARAAGQADREFSLLLQATNELPGAGRPQAALEAARRLLELGKGETSRVPIAYGQLGLAYLRLGQPDQAIAQFREADRHYDDAFRKLARQPQTPAVQDDLSHLARLRGIVLMRTGNAHKQAGRYDLAEGAYLQARVLLEKYNRKGELTTLLSNFGSLQSLKGEHKQAAATYEQALALAREAKDRNEECEILLNLANAQGRAGDNAAALETYASAYTLLPPDAGYEVQTGLLGNWILSLVEDGNLREAERLADQLRGQVRPGDEHTNRILLLVDRLVKDGGRTATPKPR